MDSEVRRYRAEYERKQKDYQRFVESIQGLEPFEKTESWLWYVANNIDYYGDQEAIVYLLSRGYDCSDLILDLINWWKKAVQWSIEECSKGIISYSAETGETKRIGGMSIAEASNVEGLGSAILRNFWGGTDKQELYIDATMLPQWNGVKLGDLKNGGEDLPKI